MANTALKFSKYQSLSYSPKPPNWKKNLRFWLKFILSIIRKYKVRIIFTPFFIFLAFFLIKTLLPSLPMFQDNLVIGVVGDHTLETLPQTLTQLYSSGLTKFDNNGQVIPALAKSWETEDGKKFKFILEDNLTWQDGKRLLASEIKFDIPNTQVQVLDEKTIEFTLTDTFIPFPATLTKPVFRQNSKIGTGPYKLEKILKNKNEEVLRQLTLVPIRKNFSQLTIRFFSNSQSVTQAFKTGQLTVIFNLLSLNGFENWKGTEVIETFDSNRVVAIFYNTKDGVLENAKIRKALDLSIDRSKFKNPATTSYSPSSWASAKIKLEFDLTRAKKIIEAENLKGKKVGILIPSIFENITFDIANNWKNLGLEVTVEEIDKIPSDFQAAIFGLEIPTDPDQYGFWHSTQSQTLTKIENPKLDKLLEDGRKTIKAEERKAIYGQLQRELVELVPASFLFFPERYVVINKNSKSKLDQVRKLFPEFPVN